MGDKIVRSWILPDMNMEQAEAVIEKLIVQSLPPQMYGIRLIEQADDPEPWIYFIQQGMSGSMRACPKNVTVTRMSDGVMLIGRVIDLIVLHVASFHNLGARPTEDLGDQMEEPEGEWSFLSLCESDYPEGRVDEGTSAAFEVIRRLRDKPLADLCRMTVQLNPDLSADITLEKWTPDGGEQ